MSILNAVILGLVEGIAEFLPISSSGHLSIVNNLFKMSNEGHQFFDALLHLGTLISIFIVYWQDIKQIYYELISFLGKGPLAGQPRQRYPAARLFLMMFVASLPLLLVLPVNDMLETLNYNNLFIGVTIILTGCTLYVADKMQRGKKSELSMTVLDALIIGICQCVAAIPGLSRTATSITAGVATGMRRDSAVKFSIFLSIPAILGSNIIALVKAIQLGVEWSNLPAYLVGMAVAMVSGIAAIQILRYIAIRGRFGGFAYYCWVMGVLSIVLSLIF